MAEDHTSQRSRAMGGERGLGQAVRVAGTGWRAAFPDANRHYCREGPLPPCKRQGRSGAKSLVAARVYDQDHRTLRTFLPLARFPANRRAGHRLQGQRAANRMPFCLPERAGELRVTIATQFGCRARRPGAAFNTQLPAQEESQLEALLPLRLHRNATPQRACSAASSTSAA